eukprot:EC793809.1.p2 GENE.EC793809.1~~EC793809.1.p2  ORF type:complete len:62 (+),score=8.16 EC793809.1:31-216(+)
MIAISWHDCDGKAERMNEIMKESIKGREKDVWRCSIFCMMLSLLLLLLSTIIISPPLLKQP